MEENAEVEPSGGIQPEDLRRLGKMLSDLSYCGREHSHEADALRAALKALGGMR